MKKILPAFDGSDEARIALDRTVELARRQNAEVGVSVVPFRPGRGGGVATRSTATVIIARGGQ